jgi:hypothetical protein
MHHTFFFFFFVVQMEFSSLVQAPFLCSCVVFLYDLGFRRIFFNDRLGSGAYQCFIKTKIRFMILYKECASCHLFQSTAKITMETDDFDYLSDSVNARKEHVADCAKYLNDINSEAAQDFR